MVQPLYSRSLRVKSLQALKQGLVSFLMSARGVRWKRPPQCVAFRKPARALPRARPSDGGEKEDGWPREPDPSSLAEAHLDNKCAGGHDDHGDISCGLSLRRA